MICFLQLQEFVSVKKTAPMAINLSSVSRIRPMDENRTIITFKSGHFGAQEMIFIVRFDDLMEYISGFQEVKMIKIQPS